MKTIASLLIILAFCWSRINAQQPILVTEDSLNFGKSVLPSLSVKIPEANYEDVLKSWKKELESVSKAKTVIDKNEITIYGAKLKNVSPDPVNVYSKITTLDSSILLTVAFEGKKDQYIDNTEGGLSFTKAKEYLKDFARSQYLDIAKDQADAEDKKLRDFQKELSSLEKDKSRLQKAIASDSTTLYTENDNIKAQKNELESVTAEIAEQNQMTTPDSETIRKEKEKIMNDLEKRRKKALNSIESSQNKISKTNNEIGKAKYEIPQLEKSQEELRGKIESQQTVYDKYADKVKTIETY